MRRYLVATLLCLLPFLPCTLRGQTFYQVIGSPGLREGGGAIAGLPDGTVVVGGFRQDSALVMRVDANGNVLWTRCFTPLAGIDSEVHDLEIGPDGLIYGVGNSTFNSTQIAGKQDGFWFKMDLSGALLWSHRETNASAVHFDEIEFRPGGTCWLTKGYVDPVGSSANYTDMGIMEISPATGAILFDSPRYNLTANPFVDDIASSVFVPGQGLYVTGRYYVDGANNGSMRPYFQQFTPGNQAGINRYHVRNNPATARLYGVECFDMGNGLVNSYCGELNGVGSNFELGIYFTDYGGVMTGGTHVNIQASSLELVSSGAQGSNLILSYGYGDFGGNLDLFLVGFDNAGAVLFCKGYGGSTTLEQSNHLSSSIMVHQGSIWFTAMEQSGGDWDLVLARTDLSGNISCHTVQNLAFSSSVLQPVTTAEVTTSLAEPITHSANPALNLSSSAACQAPPVNLGPNVSTCTTATLNATTPGATAYAWSTGATTPTITVASTGTYSVTVYNGCCSRADTIVVQAGALALALPPSTPICTGSTATLSVPGGFATYAWSTGATTPSITVSNPGTYTVTVTDAIGCIGSDTTVATLVPNPIPNLGPDQALCPGVSATLSTGLPGPGYLWSNSASTPTITVGAPGTFHVQVTDANGCVGRDTVTLTALAAPVVSIGPDQTICAGSSASFSANPAQAQYAWSTGGSGGSVQVGSAGPVSVTVTAANGCTASDTALVTVVPSPVVNLGPDITLCVGSSQTLNAGNPGASYLWSTGASTQSISVSVVGTYSVTVTNGFGCTGTDAVNISSPSPMSLSFGTSPDACATPLADGTASVSVSGGTAPYSYLWSTLQTQPFLTGLAAGTYSVTVTDLSGCVVSGSVVVAQSPGPAVVAGPDASFCEGSGGASLSATVSGGSPGYWLSWWCAAPSCGLSNANGLNPVANPTVSQWYYVQATDTAGCLSNVDSLWVAVLPKPVVDAGADHVLCGDSAPCTVLTPTVSGAPGPYTYQWLPSTGLNDSTLMNPCARPDTTTIYALVVASANGCSSDYTTTDTLATVTVHVNPIPAGDAGPDLDICLGDTAVLQATWQGAGPAYQYQWSPSTGLSNPAIANPQVSPGATTTYSFVVWSNGCPSYADTVQCRVHTLPTVDAGPDRDICPGGTALLDGSAGGDSTASYTFVWSPGLTLADSTVEDASASPGQTTTYTVHATSSHGCDSPADTVRVTVIPAPVADAGPNLHICPGDSALLLGSLSYTTTDTAPAGQVYFSWSPAWSMDDSTLLQPSVWPGQSTVYWLTVRHRTCSSTDSVLVTTGPVSPAVADADTHVVCAGVGAQLHGYGPAGSTAMWLPATGLDDPGSFDPVATPLQTTLYSFVLAHGGCVDTAEVLVEVLPVPAPAFLHSGLVGCAPLPVQFIDASQGAVGLVWDFGDGGAVANVGSVVHTFEEAGQYTVGLRALGVGGCAADAGTVVVEVLSPPVADFGAEPGWPAVLSLPAGGVQFVNGSSGGVVSYAWDFGDGTWSGDVHPGHVYAAPGVYFVTLVATGVAGCVDSVRHGPFVVEEPGLFIPNVFSPNGDGVSDVFVVEYTGSQPFRLRVVDRWGVVVHGSVDRLSGWDGLDLKGNVVPEGVYYYHLEVGDRNFAGPLTLLR